jgi:hypothetical protein
MRDPYATTLLCCAALVFGYLAGYQHGEALGQRLAAQHQVIATCPNYDSVRVMPTPWEYERGRKIRTIPAPECAP